MSPTTTTRQRGRFARAGAAGAAGLAMVLLPLGAAPAQAAADPQDRQILPPGVVKLNDSEPCPPASLCLYRDYGFSGPAYAIGAGYEVNLHALPMEGGVHGPSAANEVSSWVNNTDDLAFLIDEDGNMPRPLFPGRPFQEPPQFNDTADIVVW